MPAGQPLAYSAVIPTKDRREAVEDAVGVLLGQTRLPARIVVVDASVPSYVPSPALATLADRVGVGLVVASSRPSTSAQRNLGARLAETPVVLFLDDDVRVAPQYAAVLLNHWESVGLEALAGIAGTPAVVPRQGRAARALRRLTMLNYVDPDGEKVAGGLIVAKKISSRECHEKYG